MNIASSILSDITVHMKYARYLDDKNRRETWDELVDRNVAMHVKKYPNLKQEINDTYDRFVRTKKVLPSMRSLQFGGKAIEISPNRVYNCFSRDTKFITDKGVKSFKDFKEGDKVTVLTHESRWKSATVKAYGEKSLNEITFRRGKSEKKVRATPDHRWILFNGENTTNLEVNTPLYPSPRQKDFDYDNATPNEKLYWCYGYVFGDGTKIKKGDKYKYSAVRLCGEYNLQFLERFEEMGFSTSTSNSLEGDVMVYTGKYLKTSPDPEKDSEQLIKAFVDGFLCADAYKNPDWYSNKNLPKYKSIQSSSKEHQKFIETCLESAGYYILNKEDLTEQETNFGVRGQTYRYSITNYIGSRPQTSWSPVSIEKDVSTEEVWCLEVEDDKSFVLSGGIVTGNCAYTAADHIDSFAEAMFLLLGGTGLGYSVQKHHVEKLPKIIHPDSDRTRRYLIDDSITGWADAVKILFKAYTGINRSKPVFDYSDIRPKGARLVTSGGKAPGPAPLRECLVKIENILSNKPNRSKLQPIEAHDIMCHIADAVLAGGIRRAAMISLFSADDDEMISAKSGSWWESNPQRGRANNSAALVRDKMTKDHFMSLWKRVEESGSGEPGIYLTKDKNWGTNPCVEIALKNCQMCNLTEVNASNVEGQQDLEERVRAASFIGTLQAGYTDFHYLRETWKRTCEKDALIGVSMTGIASGNVMGLDLEAASKVVKDTNAEVAKLIGINKAARTTCVKPAGTTSLVLGTSSGIHAWHNDYYIRRIRVGKNEAIYSYLYLHHPELVEDEHFRPHDTAVISVPQKAPEDAILRTESPLETLERVKKVSQYWIKPGHRKGENTHNVSCTISLKDDQWRDVGNWMWKNREYYNGIAVLPFDGGSYQQAPFEDCSRETYEAMVESLHKVDLTKVIEVQDNTDLSGEIACAGPQGCEVV